MKINATGLGIVAIILLILLTAVVNLAFIPWLMMVVLSALGVKLSFWVCLGIWVLLVTLLNIIK